jgi:hypothetical protein
MPAASKNARIKMHSVDPGLPPAINRAAKPFSERLFPVAVFRFNCKAKKFQFPQMPELKIPGNKIIIL